MTTIKQNQKSEMDIKLLEAAEVGHLVFRGFKYKLVPLINAVHGSPVIVADLAQVAEDDILQNGKIKFFIPRLSDDLVTDKDKKIITVQQRFDNHNKVIVTMVDNIYFVLAGLNLVKEAKARGDEVISACRLSNVVMKNARMK